MSEIVIRDRNVTTLPMEALERLGMGKNDSFNWYINEKQELVLVPMVKIPKSQTFYWTKEWQEKEREVQKEIDEGNLKSYSLDELMEKLTDDNKL